MEFYVGQKIVLVFNIANIEQAERIYENGDYHDYDEFVESVMPKQHDDVLVRDKDSQDWGKTCFDGYNSNECDTYTFCKPLPVNKREISEVEKAIELLKSHNYKIEKP